MARLDGGRFNRWLEKFFNIKQAGNTFTSVEDAIRPVVSLPIGAEDRYLQGWLLNWIFFQMAAPGAGVFAQCQIRNPVGSGIIAVVHQVTYSSLALDVPILTLVRGKTTDYATLSPVTVSLDARAGGAQVVMSQGSAAALPSGQTTGLINAVNTTSQFMVGVTECPILPGDALVGSSTTANQAANFAFYWRTRGLEQSEFT